MAPRYILLLFVAALSAPAVGQLVINEVDYDQPGNDSTEFVELRNNGDAPVDLSTIAVRMINGSSGTGVVYRSYFSDTWPLLAPGGYFTLCGDTTAGCDAHLSPSSNAVQNGATDAIALILRSDSSFIDRVSYEGTLAGYAEGIGFEGMDNNVHPVRSIGRYPDGADTDDNNTDLIVMCSTPGAANLGDTLACNSVGVRGTAAPEGFTVLPDASGTRLQMAYAPAQGKVTFEVFSVDGSLLADRTVAAAGKAVWSMATGNLQGRMLIVRVSGPMGTKAKRVVLP